ncbi:uncharacterized protein LOC144375767 [Ictidomys tridecemlineatus]
MEKMSKLKQADFKAEVFFTELKSCQYMSIRKIHQWKNRFGGMSRKSKSYLLSRFSANTWKLMWSAARMLACSFGRGSKSQGRYQLIQQHKQLLQQTPSPWLPQCQLRSLCTLTFNL